MPLHTRITYHVVPPTECPRCHGTGEHENGPARRVETCGLCGGRGQVYIERRDSQTFEADEVLCWCGHTVAQHTSPSRWTDARCTVESCNCLSLSVMGGAR